ncbi:MAG TPA: DinB family protein [Anaerolineae bacterium]
MSEKSELLDGLQAEYLQWRAFLDQIGATRMDQPGVTGHWSIKDIIAHLTGWRRRTVARLQAVQRDEPDSPPPWPAQLKTDDEINAWIYESNHGRPVQDVLNDSHQVFQQLLAAIEALPDQVLLDPVHHLPWLDGQPFGAGEFFAHFHQEHEPDMRAWLARGEKPMKPADTLTILFGHNRWANLHLLEKCAALSQEQLDAAITGGYGSIRDTLQHIVTGEQLYFSLISTGQRYERPEDAPPMPLAEMVDAAQITGAGLIEWAPRVQADQVDGEGIPKTFILTQAINHATEHRAQIMAILTQLGIQPPELDGWTYAATFLISD